MNKLINILLGLLFLLTMAVTIFVGFDLPIEILRTSGAHLPYKEEILFGLGLCIFLVVLRRAIRRWMGRSIVKKTTRFKWNQPVSRSRVSRVQTYLMIEFLVMLIAGTALYIITPVAVVPAIAYVIGAIDNLVFAIAGRKSYRIGISSKALIVADREVILLYFKGLRKVSAHQQTIFFDYIKDLQLSFPTDCIQEGMKEEFFSVLEKQIDSDRVFFSRTMV